MMKIYIHTVEKRTAQQIFDRLEQPEKIELRRAGPDRIQWMANNSHRHESAGDVSVVQGVQDLCQQEWANFDHLHGLVVRESSK